MTTRATKIRKRFCERDFVERIYEFNLMISDIHVLDLVKLLTGHMPSRETLGVWKARIRRNGVSIPDRRRKKTK